LVAALTVVAAPAYAQTGEVTNSKYLEIIEHRYHVGEFSDTITGTVKNISTEEYLQSQFIFCCTIKPIN
jgi:hypothetical protein